MAFPSLDEETLEEARDELVAHHEAGHAVAAKALGFEIPRHVSIVPVGNSLGRCEHRDGMRWPKLNAPVLGREWVGRSAICFLAGHAAEKRLAGGDFTPSITVECLLALPYKVKASRDAQATEDLNAADRVLRAFEPFERERGRWLAISWVRACRLVEQEWGAVQRLAEALLAHRRLEGDAVVELLSGVTAMPLAEPLR